MPTAATSALPDGVSQYMHDVITGEGFTYTVDYRHDITAIREDDAHRIQIRAESVPNKPHVKRLTEAIKAGAKLELIAITKDEYLDYGNHRFAAYKAAGASMVPVIILDVNAETADADTLARLRIVGIRENARPHLPNSAATDEMAVVVYKREGWDNTRIARELGVRPNRISEILAVDKGIKVLADLGFGADVKPTKTVCAALGRASEELNKAPLGELAKLAMDADLTAKEVRTIAAEAKATGSDTDGVKVVADARSSLAQRVSGSDAGGRPTYAAQLRQKLGFITGKAGNAQLLVERGPGASEHLDMVLEAIAVLTEVRNLMATPEADAA
jgi:ParB-like chromosome segregation protein Spo0J